MTENDINNTDIGVRSAAQRKFFLLALILFFAFNTFIFAGSDRINVNEAGLYELQTLPYIGELRAKAIIKSRTQVGKFRNIKDLVNRKIIGRETFSAIQHRISLFSIPSLKTFQPISITNIHINGLKGKVFFLENRNFARVLRAKIDQAKNSIRIITFLFKTSKNKYNYATQLSEQLIQAQERGVKVDIILELSNYNLSLNESNEFTLRNLRKSGIKVRFDSIKKQTHTKLAIIDDTFTFIGSHNLSHSALGINNELTLMIESKDVAKKSLEYFRSIQ
ncbi:MAG: hypothetical protein GY866_00595 [Proteobacteria bacterium]|nr:hypothetical protein [Pseudomonadota bacterium]